MSRLCLKDQDKDKDSSHKDQDQDFTFKDKDKDKDLLLVLKESLGTRTRTMTTITGWNRGPIPLPSFLADRTIGRAFGTLCRLSVCLSSVVVCDVFCCGKTVRPSENVSEGVNRKPGSKSSFLGSPPYFYFQFRRYGHQYGRFALFLPVQRSNRY